MKSDNKQIQSFIEAIENRNKQIEESKRDAERSKEVSGYMRDLGINCL